MLAPASFPLLYPLGDAALVVQFGDAIAEPTHHAIQALGRLLDARPVPGLREYVPAFTTLTVFYDPWVVSQGGRQSASETMAATLRQLLDELPVAPTPAPAPPVEIPVCYGGQFGPDLELVARHAGLTAAEVIGRHTAPEYLVYMLGFAPGFPYLGGLDERLATPRRTSPRARVPAGTVGIAGAQTGIYSLPTPGGWQLIGRTPRRLFTPEAASPSLLRAGQRLRFVAVSEAEYHHLLELEHER